MMILISKVILLTTIQILKYYSTKKENTIPWENVLSLKTRHLDISIIIKKH